MMHWQKQEKGWYTSDIGGVVLERDGKWWFYPLSCEKEKVPFKSLKLAKKFLEKENEVPSFSDGV